MLGRAVKMSSDRIYWDSCCFTSRIERTPGRIQILEHITDRAERGEIVIVTSAFTLVEVAKVNLPPGLEHDEQERLIVDFFDNPYILPIQLDLRVAKIARDIIRNYSAIKGKDAIHIASAIQAGVSVMHTYDVNHILPKDGKIGNPPLRIKQPEFVNGQIPLYMGEIDNE